MVASTPLYPSQTPTFNPHSFALIPWGLMLLSLPTRRLAREALNPQSLMPRLCPQIASHLGFKAWAGKVKAWAGGGEALREGPFPLAPTPLASVWCLCSPSGGQLPISPPGASLN